MLPASYATFTSAVFLIGGLLACFAGYRLFRFVLGLYGFVLGAMYVTNVMGGSNTWALTVAAIVGGLLGAALMVAAYFIGVGLIGAGLAALAMQVVWHFIGGQVPTLILVIGCVLGALGALSVARYVVVFGTAIAGSWTMIVGGLAMLGDRSALVAASAGDVWVLYPLDPLPGRWWHTLLWFALTIAGVVVQLATTKKGGGKKRARKKE